MKTNGLRPRDSFSIQLLIEEGLLIGRMLDQGERYPEAGACLALTAFPFLAVAEHGAIPFLNQKLGCGLPTEDSRITTIRHMTKSLDSKSFNYKEYAEEARAVIESLERRFYSTTALGRLTAPLQTNVGISYYHHLPIYTTYSTIHLMTKNSPGLMQSSGHAFEKEIGYEAGASGAIIYAIAREFEPHLEKYRAREFRTQANDWKYEQLVSPLRDKGIEDQAVFFFFSELLMLLTSVCALREAGFLDDAVWLKYSSLTLEHTWRAIDNFAAYSRTTKVDPPLASAFLDDVGHLLNRDEKKLIKRSHPLRNAMMHYDFTEDLAPDGVDGSNPWEVIDVATMRVCGKPVKEFGEELFRVRDKLAKKICELIGFPCYSPSRQPWGQ